MSNVISLFTGAPLPDAVGPANGKAVRILERYLAMARSGQLTGLALACTTMTGKEFDYAMPAQMAPCDSLIAGLNLLNMEITNDAWSFGAEASEDLFDPA